MSMDASKKKKKLEAKLFPWKARKPLWEMAKKYKRQKYVLIAVWDYMMWRSGRGNLFELAEELVILDTGMDKNALRWARRTLIAEGWLRKEIPRRPSGTREVTRWIVCIPEQQPVEQAVAHQQQPLEQAIVQAAVGSTSDCSTGDTVVSHLLDADASTTDCDATLLQPQVSELVSERVSEAPLATLATPATGATKEEELMAIVLAEAMGIHVLLDQHVPALRIVVAWARFTCLTPDGYRERCEYIAAMYVWTQGDGFWKKRVLGLDNFAKFLGRVDEKGMVAKYERHLGNRRAKTVAKAVRENPLWGNKPVGDGETIRKILRKPLTKEERLELLHEMSLPKKNKELFKQMLAQDTCPTCHGQDTSCPCVLLEGVIAESEEDGWERVRSTAGSAD
jgi:hypothetical protein